jgi:hypothetical protein
LTLENHLEWLKSAGFSELACLWKEIQRAGVFGMLLENGFTVEGFN